MENFRAIMYYNFQRQLSQQECLAELLSVFGNEAPHQSTISRCLSDDPRVGAPKTAVTQENLDAINMWHIARLRRPWKILNEELGVRKLVSRWIPHLLTEEQKAARVNWCQKTLDRFNSGNSKNVYSISAVWVFQGEEKPTKVIRSRSVSKKMVATFVSKAGHIATIPLNEQRTVTLRKINPERRIILHQDNAAQKTRQYLTEENVELLDHPPYSPDLSPNDFLTFPKIKNRLRGQRFQSPEEAVDAFKTTVLDLPANECIKCFENWFERMQLCINLQESLLPVVEECLTSGQDFAFQQDGAACHTSKKAIKWMEENSVPLLKWVSSSPNLSPIETLWHEMKKVLRQHPARIITELRQKLQEIWDCFIPNFCQKLP
ncbi:unnamed protein product [Acanthoscelides obtectus]|uniref:Transposase n=1 Tax=Acanthoscelides obtectus TaxID=200917 RepID=A0A9P0KTP6_ACAOB|nr:unnamed protein product [Acanthoscelides obtectus]CAK1672040.1 Histone-lysine N-methyltransferase SETMAR [Acanthoscelides obtectus]